jgi:hypothetical protein
MVLFQVFQYPAKHFSGAAYYSLQFIPRDAYQHTIRMGHGIAVHAKIK